jgi:threonine dehydratase/serine racemase
VSDTGRPPAADVGFVDVRAAASRLAGEVHRTPVITSESLDRWAGANVFLKAENLQKVGAFKARGALNAVLSLPADVAARGVAAHSSGNHAAALAFAGRRRGIPVHVVMPSGAAASKRAAVEAYGAAITTCEPTLAAREACLAEVVQRTGATEIHPYDDRRVIAGAGTAALELVSTVDGLDAVVAPVGGGGLLSGTSIVARHAGIDVWGAEPSGADDARRSFVGGRLEPSIDPVTVADGLRTSLSHRTLAIIRANARDIVLVDDADTLTCMRLVWERTKLLVEPSAAVAVAAVPALVAAGHRRIGVIVSGGNVDLDHLPF